MIKLACRKLCVKDGQLWAAKLFFKVMVVFTAMAYVLVLIAQTVCCLYPPSSLPLIFIKAGNHTVGAFEEPQREVNS